MLAQKLAALDPLLGVGKGLFECSPGAADTHDRHMGVRGTEYEVGHLLIGVGHTEDALLGHPHIIEVDLALG